MTLLSLDVSLITQIIIAALGGAFLCLDRIAFQTMVSRPLVIATITAWIMGNTLAGLMVGALLELFWLNKLPLGTYAPPNDSIAAILTAITTTVLIKEMGPLYSPKAIMAFSLLIYIPLGWFAPKTEYLWKNFNKRLSDKLLAELDSPQKHFSPIRVFPSLAWYFLYSLFFIAMGLAAGLLLIPPLFSLLPSFGHTALAFIYYLFPLIGVAAVITTTQNKKVILYFSGIFILAALLYEIGTFI
ncbi:MAG: PTS sugar transporter subunit IIC [Syntrophobacterales bacterium]|jgi:PTS system mannose-specific IIC component|nr:PTS sugar transporter subunit IIC [Syntrophobacterales bacterium]